MADNNELKEELLEEVTGGFPSPSFGGKKTEESVIDDAKKKIAATAKVGKAINDAGEKKVATNHLLY